MEASETPTTPDPVQDAVAAIGAAEARVQVTTGGAPGAKLPDVKLDRLSVERRVLGHITDEVQLTELGSRNTLAALAHDLIRDRNTTDAPPPNPSLDIKGKGLPQIIAEIHDILTGLVEKGLAKVRDDGSYELTDAGHRELSN